MAKNPQDKAPGRVDSVNPNEFVSTARDAVGGKAEIKKVKKTSQAKSGAPDNAGTAQARVPVLVPGEAYERYGAKYRTDIGMPLSQNVPEASFTQANGRVIRSAVRRDRTNFWASVGDVHNG